MSSLISRTLPQIHLNTFSTCCHTQSTLLLVITKPKGDYVIVRKNTIKWGNLFKKKLPKLNLVESKVTFTQIIQVYYLKIKPIEIFLLEVRNLNGRLFG
jgi:hypothetical protein